MNLLKALLISTSTLTTLLYAAEDRTNLIPVPTQCATAHTPLITDHEQEHIIFNAAVNGNFDIIVLYILSDANLDSQINSGHTLLETAAVYNHPDIVTLLLDNGAYVNAVDAAGGTALHAVCGSENQIDIVKILLNHGANVNAANKYGETPLYIAEMSGNHKAIELLTHYGARNLQNTRTPTLIPHRATPPQLITPPYNRQASPQLPTTALTPPTLTIPHYNRQTPSKSAAATGTFDTTLTIPCDSAQKPQQLPATTGASSTALTIPCDSAQTPPQLPATRREIRTSKTLPRIDVFLDPETHEVKEIRYAQHDVNARDGVNNTLLHWACAKGKTLLAARLLSYGATLDAENCLGYTPLHLASLRGKLNLVHFLISKGANINAKTRHSYTALLLAAQKNDTDVVKYLLDNNASKDDVRGKQSAFRQTCLLGHLHTARTFMEHPDNYIDLTNQEDTFASGLLFDTCKSLATHQSKSFEYQIIIKELFLKIPNSTELTDENNRTALSYLSESQQKFINRKIAEKTT